MSDATQRVTMLTASTRQDRFFLTACRARAQAADDARASMASIASNGTHVLRARRQAAPLLTHPFVRATYATERASHTQRQRAKPVSLLTITKRRLLDEPFRLWRRRHT